MTIAISTVVVKIDSVLTAIKEIKENPRSV